MCLELLVCVCCWTQRSLCNIQAHVFIMLVCCPSWKCFMFHDHSVGHKLLDTTLPMCKVIYSHRSWCIRTFQSGGDLDVDFAQMQMVPVVSVPHHHQTVLALTTAPIKWIFNWLNFLGEGECHRSSVRFIQDVWSVVLWTVLFFSLSSSLPSSELYLWHPLLKGLLPWVTCSPVRPSKYQDSGSACYVNAFKAPG